MINKKLILMQKIVVFTYLIVAISMFVFAISYTTPLYNTKLYGNSNLLAYYENDLQVFNRYLFNISIVFILIGALFLLVKLVKYFTGVILYPVVSLSMIITTILSIICINKQTPIREFYTTYDYSSIRKLENFEVSNTLFDVNNVIMIMMIVTSIITLIVVTIGFITLLKTKRNGDNHEEN